MTIPAESHTNQGQTDLPENLSPLQVVAGVVRCGGKIMVARRASGKHLAGFWEFPGGKIEAGELAEQSLARELMEEFGIHVKVGEKIGSRVHDYPSRTIELHAFWAETEAECAPGDSHDAVAWIAPDELHQYHFAEADLFLLPLIITSHAAPGP